MKPTLQGAAFRLAVLLAFALPAIGQELPAEPGNARPAGFPFWWWIGPELPPEFENAKPVENVPRTGTFYSLTLFQAPFPLHPFPELPVYQIAERVFVYDDRTVDYAALREAQRAQAETSLAQTPGIVLSGGPGSGGLMMLLGGAGSCITNVPLFIANLASTFVTNQGWTVTFDIQGGTNGLLYDVFTTSGFVGNSMTNSQWTWLERGPTCSTYQYTNQPAALAFYALGTPQDSDADGLTDAYETLASKTQMEIADTDGDGLSDWYELVVSLTNPLLAESAPSLAGRPISKCPAP